MKTTEYPWYLPSFPEYNEAQSSVVPFLDKDVNLVVSFATAVGKTVLAEGAMAYHLKEPSRIERGCRVAYVCPFKSLASEKFQAWKEDSQFNQHGVVLWSSDSDDTGDGNDRMVVATLESFDAKTRSEGWRSWTDSFDCVVYDESHIIGDDARGGAMEASIMRLTENNPSIRIILLSATMGNSMEVAGWIKSLNGKNTKCITSSWRPTKVRTKYHPIERYEDKVTTAVSLAIKSSSQKTLVFVHSKVTGAEIVKRLRKNRTRAVFHNASLSGAKRKKIEGVFNDPSSGLNILVSTSTLGAGVNVG